MARYISRAAAVTMVLCLTADEDFDTGAMVFVARCHGAEERVEIDRREIVEGARIEAGVAFAAPQIEARR